MVWLQTIKKNLIMKKIKLSEMLNRLDRSEMKNIIAGSGGSTCGICSPNLAVPCVIYPGSTTCECYDNSHPCLIRT